MGSTIRPRSSFLKSLRYVPLAKPYRTRVPGCGLLLVEMKGNRAYCYLVPSYVAGLLAAAKANSHSLGRLYGRLVRGRPQIKFDPAFIPSTGAQ